MFQIVRNTGLNHPNKPNRGPNGFVVQGKCENANTCLGNYHEPHTVKRYFIVTIANVDVSNVFTITVKVIIYVKVKEASVINKRFIYFSSVPGYRKF